MRQRPSIARPSHRICVVSQVMCVPRRLTSQIMCAGIAYLLRVGPFIIVRRYSYRPPDIRLLLRRTANGITGQYALAGCFGSLSGTADSDTLRFTWTSGPVYGWGTLRRSGDDYEGATEDGGLPGGGLAPSSGKRRRPHPSYLRG